MKTGGLVLYLDFDGVLHHEDVRWTAKGPRLFAPEPYRLFQHVDLLASLLAAHPRVSIVLSTSWVLRYGCTGAARKLPTALADRVVGATFHSGMDRPSFLAAPRGMQIWGDVFRRQPVDWLAIDDDALHWPAWCRDKLVRTDEREGIGSPDIAHKIQLGLARLDEEGAPKAPR